MARIEGVAPARAYFLSKAKRTEERLKSLAALKAAAMVGCPF